VKSGRPFDRNLGSSISRSQNKEYTTTIAEDGKGLVGEL
jgi:hypothetical protein